MTAVIRSTTEGSRIRMPVAEIFAGRDRASDRCGAGASKKPHAP
jgi:hypothetical protein